MRLTKPSRPEWMSRDFYNQWVPDELTIRVIKNKKRTIVTPLLNPEQYPKNEIIGLYQERWHVELDFRAIKSLMHMDILRCKTPEMVRKEIDVHLLVYNLIRALMARSAVRLKNKPREISFKAAQECLQEFHVCCFSQTFACCRGWLNTWYRSQESTKWEIVRAGTSHERSKDDHSLTNGSSIQEHKRADSMNTSG